MRAANPAAEDASPAAVGKLLEDTMRRGKVDSLGREGCSASSSARRRRRDARHAWDRAPSRDSGLVFKVSSSGGE